MKFPKDFCDISDRSFGWVYINKQDFVDHTLNEMQNPTGLFKKWFDYCKARVKKTTENKKEYNRRRIFIFSFMFYLMSLRSRA